MTQSRFFGLIKMVWLVQNCRSNKCLQFLKSPELPGGLAPLGTLPGLCLGPAVLEFTEICLVFKIVWEPRIIYTSS
jgi:hypothetical protein